MSTPADLRRRRLPTLHVPSLDPSLEAELELVASEIRLDPGGDGGRVLRYPHATFKGHEYMARSPSPSSPSAPRIYIIRIDLRSHWEQKSTGFSRIHIMRSVALRSQCLRDHHYLEIGVRSTLIREAMAAESFDILMRHSKAMSIWPGLRRRHLPPPHGYRSVEAVEAESNAILMHLDSEIRCRPPPKSPWSVPSESRSEWNRRYTPDCVLIMCIPPISLATVTICDQL
uniref:Uncharacterized protein n=1 Tax=Steinernema glaseri TaxID=37863 RepID=A0A1I7Z4I4_9BILA